MFPLKIMFSPSLFNNTLEVLRNTIREGKQKEKRSTDWKEEIFMSTIARNLKIVHWN